MGRKNKSAISSDPEDDSYQPRETFEKQHKEWNDEKVETKHWQGQGQKTRENDLKTKTAKDWNDDEVTFAYRYARIKSLFMGCSYTTPIIISAI